nr:hypothetical protein [Bacillus mycoides]
MKDVLKSRGLWIAVSVLVGMVLMDTIPNFNTGRYQQYVDTIILILAAAGVIPISREVVKNAKDRKDK